MPDLIGEAIREIKNGRMVIVTDDESRENEGDLIMAAEKITAESVNFMATYGRGLICVPMDRKYADKFGLDLMVKTNTERLTTNFTVSVDYKPGTTTGISMSDRSKTIKALSNLDTDPDNFLRPGHVFPLIARCGGLDERPGHTEAAVELARLAGLSPVGVLCEIIKDDGEMARFDDLKIFSERFGLKMITISALKGYLKAK